MQEFKFFNLTHKVPSGTAQAKQKVSYTLEVAQNVYTPKVYFVYFKDGETERFTQEMHFVKMENGYKQFIVQTHFNSAGLYWYYFIAGDKIIQAGKNDGEIVAQKKLSTPFSEIVTANKPIMDTINYTDGIIYHIFVDRFNKLGEVESREPLFLNPKWGGSCTDSTDYKVINSECYGGNLKGITQKLPYLKTLNVKILYLSPIFYANSNHKYNTADFMQIDPMFGSEEDLKELCAKAEKLGIKVILDGVFNHVGSDSLYFDRYSRFGAKGAYNSLSSKYIDWFNFAEWPNTYDCWWGDPTLPCLNESNRAYQNLIVGKNGVIEKYMGLGVSGFRLDVVDELGDQFLNKICKKIYDINKSAIIIGEVWEDASKKISYNERRNYLLGKQLNSVTNYPLKDAILEYVKSASTDLLEDTFNNIQDDYPNFVKYNLMNIIGSHDTTRIYSFLKVNSVSTQDAIKRLKVATLIQYVFVGIPTIYYGDETLLEDLKPNNSRNCFPWGKENINCQNWFISLGKLRKEKAVVMGEIDLFVPENGVVIIKRSYKKEEILLVTNMQDNLFELSTEDGYVDYFTSEKITNKIKVASKGFALLKRKK
ncbi:MAG: glycoside hydrolase family 13 protein [Christensenellales bacterium]